LQEAHPRVILLEGNSVDPAILQEVRKISNNKKTMVILDSDHNANHVLSELNFFNEIVTSGCYMICEDTNLNGNPVFSSIPYNPGSHEAVEEFLKENSHKWEIDRNCKKFLMTCNHGGFLLKK
jgi:cephalosporin hydroxylase